MRISNSLIEGEVREIKPFIFATIIKNQYDRSSLQSPLHSEPEDSTMHSWRHPDLTSSGS